MAARQTRRQLQLSNFEMGMIAAGFVATVTTVFFLGLFVGKRNASWHAPAEDRVARIPVDDFTRYKRPAPIEKPVKQPKPAEVVASASSPAAPAAASAAPLAKGPAGPAGPALPTPAPVPAAEAAKPAKPEAADPAGAAKDAAAAKDSAKDAAKGKDLAAAKEAAAREAAAKEAAAKKAAAEKAEKDKEAAEPTTGKGYTVQILATRKQNEADALVQQLKAHGYAAYIKRVSNGGESWYRVRVGSYGAFSEAKGMADKCRRDMSLGQAFVSTE